MSTDASLLHQLGALGPYLDDQAVTDIRVQGARTFIKRQGVRHYQPVELSLPEKEQARLAKQVAGFVGGALNEHTAMAGAKLPDGSRVQLAIAPASPETLIIIRKHARVVFTLEQYAEQGAFDNVRHRGSTLPADQVITFLREATVTDRTMMVSAGTNAGKTTFLRALVNDVPLEHHLCFIQDTDEMPHLKHLVVTKFLYKKDPGPGDVTVQDALEAALRADPDHIYLGEIRGAEALQFMSAVNTGHEGSISTIHANSPEDALRRLAECIWLNPSMQRLSFEQIHKNFATSIDIIAQMTQLNDGRRVLKELYTHE